MLSKIDAKYDGDEFLDEHQRNKLVTFWSFTVVPEEDELQSPLEVYHE